MLSEIYQEKFIVNIDGWSFGRSLKFNYSWLPKGKGSSIINTTWKGTTNMILGLTIDGQWLWIMLDWMNNKYTFWIYLFILKRYIELVWRISSTSIKVMLDNASIHLTNEVKRISKHLSFGLQYLPPYCPHLAPIELIFGVVKRRISNQKNKNLIDFSKLSGKKAIVNSLEHISTEICMNFWRKFIKEAKASIMSARDTIKEQRIINKYNEERKNNILD